MVCLIAPVPGWTHFNYNCFVIHDGFRLSEARLSGFEFQFCH